MMYVKCDLKKIYRNTTVCATSRGALHLYNCKRKRNRIRLQSENTHESLSVAYQLQCFSIFKLPSPGDSLLVGGGRGLVTGANEIKTTIGAKTIRGKNTKLYYK